MSLRVLFLMCVTLPAACESDETPSSDTPTAQAQEAAKHIDPTKQAEAKKARGALANATPQAQASIATAAIIEIDGAALPAPLVEGLHAITQSAPDMRATMLAKSLSENMRLLEEVCGPEASALMRSLGTMDVSGRDTALWDGCDLERHGLISKPDRTGSDPLLAVVAHMVFLHLGKNRKLSQDERSLLRTMMHRGETTP